jgi:V8-like Glu-specific endopeptidase
MLYRNVLISALFLFSLGGCRHKNVDQIYNEIKQSIVLISYQNKKGHGTGFFVDSETTGFCSILTTAHSTGSNQDLNLWITDDQKPTQIKIKHISGQRINNLDLAILKFNTSDKGNCPYKSLKLSDKALNTGTPIRIIGYVSIPLTLQLSDGNISILEDRNSEGYGVTHTAKTVPGMSGSPILNNMGEVVAIHGRGDDSEYGSSIPAKKYLEYLEEQKRNKRRFKSFYIMATLG